MGDLFEHGVSVYGSEERQKLCNEWTLAREKLSITFTAEHGGGYPPCLEHLSADARLSELKCLGFRVRRRWEIDDSCPGDTPEMKRWVTLAGGICVNLDDGWVCREVRA